MTAYARYSPLDVILQDPGVRILRALRWFDAVTRGELFLALEVPEYRDDARSRDVYGTALQRLLRLGHVERPNAEHARSTYRITPSGRAFLAARLDGNYHVNRKVKSAA